MNEKLQEFDPELYKKIRDDFDKHEVRVDEAIVIEDWIATALIAESLLGLLRKGLIDITGVRITEDNQLEPTFVHNGVDTMQC